MIMSAANNSSTLSSSTSSSSLTTNSTSNASLKQHTTTTTTTTSSSASLLSSMSASNSNSTIVSSTTNVINQTTTANQIINPASNDSNSNDSLASSSALSTTGPTNTTTTTTTTAATTTTTNVPAISSIAPSSSNNDSRWIFSAERIQNSPSRKDGITLEDELNQRQESALFISDLGTILKVNQLCINTAIIYMHRFYMIHSLKKFHHYVRMVATACLFFACKIEEQPRRLREVIDSIQKLFHKSNEPISQNSEEHRKYGEEIVALESCLIQTLGFNVLINHAHTVIIKTCQMIKAPRDLAEAAYLTATNSLILTNFCVKFSSEKVACFCIYLACKWTSLIIPTSSEGLQWYQYVKHDIVEQELEDISKEYLTIYGQCPQKIQKKLGKSKNIDETISYDSRSNKSPSLKPQQTTPQHPHSNHPQNSHMVKKPTTHPNPQAIDMHPKKQQMTPNVNINDPQHISNYQRQQTNKQLLHPQPNKQPHPMSQNGSHPKLPPSHNYPNQQYPQQQQNRLLASQQPSSQTAAPLTVSNPTTHNLNKPNNVGQPLNGQPFASNSQIPNQSKQHGQHSTKSSFNSPNLNKTNGISTNNFTNQPGASQLNNVSNNGSENVSNNIYSMNNTNKNFHLNNSHNNPKKPTANMNSSTNLTPQSFKSSPSTSTSNLNANPANINASMKRGNEELASNLTAVPNKIAKYVNVVDQKSAP